MINFCLPNLCGNYLWKLNIFIIQFLKSNPSYFYPNISINTVYGNFPNIPLGGDIIQTGENYSLKEIIDIINSFNQHNKVNIRLMCDNLFLENNDIQNDFISNLLIFLLSNSNNQISISNINLENYIKENFKGFQYVSSFVNCLNNDLNSINENTLKYDIVCLNYNKNNNFDFLSKIKEPNKIEITLNPYNMFDYEYYENISKCQLGIIDYKYSYNDNFYKLLKSNNNYFINVEDLYNKYYNIGFRNFRIDGRQTKIIDLIESYLYYLILPEHIDEVRNYILRTLFNH